MANSKILEAKPQQDKPAPGKKNEPVNKVRVNPANYNGDTEAAAMESSNKGKGPAGENL